MTYPQVIGLVKQVLLIAGLALASVAVLSILGFKTPLIRADLMQLAAVAAACIFASR